MHLWAATAADVAFVMAAERAEGYDRLVGRWSEDEHRASLAAPGSELVVGERREGAPEGFAILQGLDDRHGNVELKRLVAARAGTGFGRPFLDAIVDRVFARPHVHRLWLDVFEHNAQARHVYGSVGFREEGVAREAYVLGDGSRATVVLMAMLRSERIGPAASRPAGLLVRPCRVDEAGDLLGLWAAARSPHATTSDTVVDVVRLLDRDPEALLVAELDGALAGALIVGWDGWRGDLYRLAVAPGQRRRGVALALVREGERRLRAVGAPRVTALVTDANAAGAALWRAAGYERDETISRYVRRL